MMSLHYRNITTALQYSLELYGKLEVQHKEIQKNKLPIKSHNLMVPYHEFWESRTDLSSENIQTLQQLNLKKGLDYPNRGHGVSRNKDLPKASELLALYHDFSHSAIFAEEGFLPTDKRKNQDDYHRLLSDWTDKGVSLLMKLINLNLIIN
jgi:hypothetical protein